MKNRWKIILIILLSALILFSIIFYVRASRPASTAKREAVALAKKYADMEEVDRFYWFSRKKTYFSLVGKDNKKNNIVVIIPKSGEKVTVYNQSEGLTETQALKKVIDSDHPKTIKKITLGMYNDEAAWEIMTANKNGELSYYLISFKTGKTINIIKNI